MANGNFASGDGSINNPYLIEDAHDLNSIRNNLSASYKLIKDIDLNISPYNEEEGWTPIGDNYIQFSGKLDGDGYIIKNLYINKTIAYVGLFGYINQGTILNIGLKNVNIKTTSNNAGSLSAFIYNSSNISNCYVTGSLSGSSTLGGLVGEVSSACNIFNSHCNINLSGASYLGGLVGRLQASSNISNCYSIGNINHTTINSIGGLVGYINNSIVSNSYWDKETSGLLQSSGGGTGLTTVQMKISSNFTNYDSILLEDQITKAWKLKSGDYPRLYFEKYPFGFLIKQIDQYYFVNDNLLTQLGNASNNLELINWFDEYGKASLNLSSEEVDKLIYDDKFNITTLK